MHHATHPVLPLLALAALLGAAAPAQADSVQFLQTGFADNATVQGFFSGRDADGDGWVQLGELSDFSLQFSGNHVMAGFSHGLANLTDFRYGTGIGTLDAGLELHINSLALDGERITSYGSRSWPLAFAEGVVMELPALVLSGTSQALQVSAVPEPGPGALLLCGVSALGWLQRRRAAAGRQAFSARWGS